MSDKQERTNQYIIYHKALERALSPLQARYDELCKNVYSMLAAEAPGLPTFFEALEIDSAAGSDAQPVERLANSAAIAVVYEYVLKALGTKPTETQNEREHAAQIMDAALPAVDIYTGTPTEIAARAKEYGDNWTYALYDTVLVSKTAKYERVRAYIRAIAPGAFADSRPNVIPRTWKRSPQRSLYLGKVFSEFFTKGRYADEETACNVAGKGRKPANVFYMYSIKDEYKSEAAAIWESLDETYKSLIEVWDGLVNSIDENDPNNPRIIWVDKGNAIQPPGTGFKKMYFTLNELGCAMKVTNRTNNISSTYLKELVNKCEQLRKIDGTLDAAQYICSATHTEYNVDVADPINGSILDFQIKPLIVDGKKQLVFLFTNYSLFGQYNRALEAHNITPQIQALSAEWYNVPGVTMTEHNQIIQRMLVERLFTIGEPIKRKRKGKEYIDHTGQGEYMLYSPFYEAIEKKKKHDAKEGKNVLPLDYNEKRRIRTVIKNLLDHYITLEECPIKDYEKWTGKTGDGLHLIPKEPKSVISSNQAKQIERHEQMLTAFNDQLKENGYIDEPV